MENFSAIWFVLMSPILEKGETLELPTEPQSHPVCLRTSLRSPCLYSPSIETQNSLEGNMTNLKKIITGTAVAALMAGTLAATPAAAWSRYRNNNAGAIAGAAIGGMALGAAIGAAASQPRYYGGYGYGYAPYGYGYGYAPYGYGYGW